MICQSRHRRVQMALHRGDRDHAPVALDPFERRHAAILESETRPASEFRGSGLTPGRLRLPEGRDAGPTQEIRRAFPRRARTHRSEHRLRISILGSGTAAVARRRRTQSQTRAPGSWRGSRHRPCRVPDSEASELASRDLVVPVEQRLPAPISELFRDRRGLDYVGEEHRREMRGVEDGGLISQVSRRSRGR
jgi:hypothetical protein